MLKGEPTQESVNGAVVWLERGAKQGNAAAKLLLSGILAASPIREIRDPPRALTLADSLERDYKIDPSFWEIRAAANASRGDYKAAVKAESKAVDEATRLGWDLAPLLQRQSLYESGQPWAGNLLAF
jgi:hypothetical protein